MNKLGEIANNIIVHATLILQGIDDLEPINNIFKHKFKHTAKNFRSEVEKTINRIHDNLPEQESKAVMACYDDYFLILGQIDRLTVQQRNKFKQMLPDIIEKL